MKTISLSIPSGYTVHEISEVIGEDSLRERLIGHYDSLNCHTAVYNEKNSTVELLTTLITCPYCGAQIPATGSELRCVRDPYEKAERSLINRVVEAWESVQLSLFDYFSYKLQINEVCDLSASYTCPHCHNTIRPEIKPRNVLLTCSKGIIGISVELLEGDFCMSYYADELSYGGDYPVYETLTLNLKKGRAYITVHKENYYKAVYINDITDRMNERTIDKVMRLTLLNRDVAEAFAELYEGYTHSEFPFPTDALTPMRLAALARFTGFDRRFYDCIPYKAVSCSLADSFRSIARRLGNTQAALEAADEYLPGFKSVRRTVFGSPGLLFYLPEIREISVILSDPNLINTLLNDRRAFDILAWLHSQPGVLEFLRDYSASFTPHKLVNRLIGRGREFTSYASRYCLMDETRKRSERAVWKKKRDPFSRSDAKYPEFSVPVSAPNSEVGCCTVNGFRFEWLRSNRDYIIAGEALNNCLKEWRMFHFPVIAVKKGPNIVAAVQIDGDYVLQAYARSNKSLDTVAGLSEAYGKWMKKFSLTRLSGKNRRLAERYEHEFVFDDEFDYDDDDDENLPF